MSIFINKTLTFSRNLVVRLVPKKILSRPLTLNKTWRVELTKTEINRTLTFSKDLVFGKVLSKFLTLDKTWEIETIETENAFILSKFLTVSNKFSSLNLKSLWRQAIVIKHVSYPTNLPLEQTSQVWIEKTDGSVDSVVPLIVFINGEPALVCNAVNPKLLIGLTDNFDIVFAYKPKNILPNQKYKFVIKRV